MLVGYRRALSLLLVSGGLFALTLVAGVRAADRDAGLALDRGWAAAPAQQRGATATCDAALLKLRQGGFTDPALHLTDRELLGGPGNRFCLFWDRLWDVYAAIPINHRSLDEFQQTKSALTPLLIEAGIDVCRIAFWQPPVTAHNQNYWHDVGVDCAPEFVAHGPRAEARIDEARAALAEAQAKTAEIFGWRLSWPLRIHLYDTQDAYVDGVRVDAGHRRAETRAKQTVGLAITQPDRITALTMNIAGFPTYADLVVLMAHEYHHITQNGYVGSSTFLPHFVIEGGAEYFASLVVGPEQRQLARRFQDAIDSERRDRDMALSKLIRDNGGVRPDPYERGYAAFRYLATRWGPDAFAQLYADNIDGSPDQYLLNLSRLTDMTLDEFDRELNAWLRTFPSTVEPRTPTPTRTPAPTRTPGARAP